MPYQHKSNCPSWKLPIYFMVARTCPLTTCPSFDACYNHLSICLSLTFNFLKSLYFPTCNVIKVVMNISTTQSSLIKLLVGMFQNKNYLFLVCQSIVNCVPCLLIIPCTHYEKLCLRRPRYPTIEAEKPFNYECIATTSSKGQFLCNSIL